MQITVVTPAAYTTLLLSRTAPWRQTFAASSDVCTESASSPILIAHHDGGRMAKSVSGTAAYPGLPYGCLVSLDLQTAVLVDLTVLTACAGAMSLRGNLRHSHPAVLYLVFHALAFSGRGLAIANGAPTFLSGVPSYDQVTEHEIVRALLYADAALVAATTGWLTYRAPHARMGDTDNVGTRRGSDPPTALLYRPLETRILVWVAIITLPIGLYVLSRYAYVPGAGVRLTTSSSYVTIATTWPGLILVALIYRFGFKLYYLLPLGAYLLLISLQGYGRFRLIIPLILLIQISLDRRSRRWPTARATAALVVVLLAFFPLKGLARNVREGAPLHETRAIVSQSLQDAFSGRSPDQTALDQLGLSLALTDGYGRTFWGEPYLSIITLPVPRELWAAKPGLSDAADAISTPRRPLGQIGGVTTLVGDLYLNFRLAGLLLLMFALARVSSRCFEAAYERPQASVGRFAYLLLACNLIQVFRDGLLSIPVFLFVNMLPLMVIVLLHHGSPRQSLLVAPRNPLGDAPTQSVHLRRPVA